MSIEADLLKKFRLDVFRHVDDLADIGKRLDLDDRVLIPGIVQTLMQMAITITVEFSSLDVDKFLAATRTEFEHRKAKKVNDQ